MYSCFPNRTPAAYQRYLHYADEFSELVCPSWSLAISYPFGSLYFIPWRISPSTFYLSTRKSNVVVTVLCPSIISRSHHHLHNIIRPHAVHIVFSDGYCAMDGILFKLQLLDFNVHFQMLSGPRRRSMCLQIQITRVLYNYIGRLN